MPTVSRKSVSPGRAGTGWLTLDEPTRTSPHRRWTAMESNTSCCEKDGELSSSPGANCATSSTDSRGSRTAEGHPTSGPAPPVRRACRGLPERGRAAAFHDVGRARVVAAAPKIDHAVAASRQLVWRAWSGSRAGSPGDAGSAGRPSADPDTARRGLAARWRLPFGQGLPPGSRAPRC
jgi:hypothetical protein